MSVDTELPKLGDKVKVCFAIDSGIDSDVYGIVYTITRLKIIVKLEKEVKLIN
jgi:hypothetical protein